jgi:heterodisulfide reductase subunit A-like polyferredoxin
MATALELFYQHLGKITPIEKVISAAKALLTGENVSEEILKARIEICSKCPYAKRRTQNGESVPVACNVCGCAVSTNSSKIINLARFVETDSYGCKHPSGSQWKAAGL